MRTFLNAGADSTCSSPITSSQTTVQLASTSAFGAPSTLAPVSLLILDAGNPNYNPANPFATGYEYQPVTNNNTGTNTLTFGGGVRAAYGGTTPRAFYAGARVVAVFLADDLIGNIAQKIAEVGPLLSSQPTIDFTSIPQTGRSLRIRWQLRGTFSGNSTGLNLRFNGDTGGNYDGQNSTIIGTAAPADNEQNGTTSVSIGVVSAATAAANHFGTGRFEIENFLGSVFKSGFGRGGYSVTTGSNQRGIVITWITWRSTAAITSISLFPAAGGSWDVGSWAALDCDP